MKDTYTIIESKNRDYQILGGGYFIFGKET